MSAVGEDPREQVPGLCCSVSFGVMENAVVLPCGHSIDESTATDLKERAGAGGELPICPECRCEFNKVVGNFALRSAIISYGEVFRRKDAEIERLQAMVTELQAAEEERVRQQTTMEELRAQAPQTAVPMPIFDPVMGGWT